MARYRLPSMGTDRSRSPPGSPARPAGSPGRSAVQRRGAAATQWTGRGPHRRRADRALRGGPVPTARLLQGGRIPSSVPGDHKPIREVTRADCRAVRDLLSSLPPNSAKRSPRLTLAQAAEPAKREGIAPLSTGTVNSYMSKLSTLMRWATREEFVDRNPAEAGAALARSASSEPRT